MKAFQKLLIDIGNRTPSSIEWLYNTYSARLYGKACDATSSEEECEAILKSVLLFVIKDIKNHKFQNSIELDIWIFRVLKYYVLLYNRKGLPAIINLPSVDVNISSPTPVSV